MDTKTTIIKDIVFILFRLLLIIIAVYKGAWVLESLLTNLAQHDDAWIPDAMMLMAVGIFIVGVFLGKPKRPSSTPSSENNTNGKVTTCCGIIFSKKGKAAKSTNISPDTEVEEHEPV